MKETERTYRNKAGRPESGKRNSGERHNDSRNSGKKEFRKHDTPRKDTHQKKEFVKKETVSQTEGAMFNNSKVPEDARKTLNDFLSIVQGVFPANSRQQQMLPQEIRELSHQLTDERDTRRMGYMNEKIHLSAYIRYYMWWNLVRLTRLFANLDFSSLNLKDGSVCIDMGSGPLTVVTALWLAHPELRSRKLTWYCVDISQQSLSLGEDIYLSVAARTPAHQTDAPESENEEGHWKIVRVKGALGTQIKQKADFITCANMFNETIQSDRNPPDFIAKKHSESLFSYLKKESDEKAVLLVEPGVPRSARFMSLMRDCFIRKDLQIIAPCPHMAECPMDGRRAGQSGANGKWCNFAFSTEDAPDKLLKLSAAAGIPKERAVLSFVFAGGKRSPADGKFRIRIASDPIRIPGKPEGYYACSSAGMILALNRTGKKITSGDLLCTRNPMEDEFQKRDSKSGATVIDV